MFSSRERSLLLLAGLAALLMTLPVLLTSWGRPLRHLEWRLQDFIHARAAPLPAREEIVVLGIDDASLELRSAFDEDVNASRPLQLIKQGWPWSREVYAEAVRKLVEAGASVVMIDLMFTGPSNDHPEGDEALRKVIADHPGKVVLGANFTTIEGSNTSGLGASMLQKPWSGIVADTTPITNNIGFINYWPDDDQVVRWTRYHRSMQYEDANRPDLTHLDQMPSAAAATLALAGKTDAIPANDHLHWPRFSSPDAYRPLSLHEIFVPEMWTSNFHNGATFKDKIVFIGPAAAHMHDSHITPVGEILGVQVHAQATGAALSRQLLHLLPWWTSVLLVFIASALAWTMVAFWRKPIETLLALIGGTLAAIVGCWWLFDQWNVVVDAVAPLAAFNLAGLLGLAYDFRLERKQRQQLRGYLQRYFSPDVVDLMLRDPEHFRTLQRGANRVITVLFSDLRGFTSMSEMLSPEELVKQLNHYFNRMVQIIHGHSGGIDKFIGDAIMAVWGWVGSDTSDASIRQTAIHAVTTTLKMRDGLRDLNAEWQAEGKPALKIGIGIHQGPAIVGDLGSETQSGFTVIGDSVNTASRLEGTTKEYGVDNIISDTVCAQVRDLFVCRSADLVRVKGKTIPVPVFTVLHEIEHGPTPGLDTYEQAMVFYRAGSFTQALEGFRSAASEGLDDELTTVFIKRCEALAATPPDTWDGVFTMTKK